MSFPQRVFSLTIAFALLVMFIGVLIGGSGISVVTDYCPKTIVLFCLLWILFLILPLLVVVPRQKLSSLSILWPVLTFIVLSSSRTWLLGLSPFTSDARENLSVVETMSGMSTGAMFDFYYSSMRPPDFSMADPEAIASMKSLGLYDWALDHWSDGKSISRCGLTPPFFFILSLGFRRIFGWLPLWPLFFTQFFSVITLAMVFSLFKKHFGIQAAYFSVLSFAFLGPLQASAANFLNDIPALFLFISGLCLIERGDGHKGWAHYFLAGSVLALACLTRLSMVPLVAGLALLCLLYNEKRLGFLLNFSLGLLTILALFYLIGFRPHALLYSAQQIRSQFVDSKHISSIGKFWKYLLYFGKLLIGLGLGWPLLVYKGLLSEVAHNRNHRRCWTKPSAMLLMLVIVLVSVALDMSFQLARNFYPMYIFVIGSALSQRSSSRLEPKMLGACAFSVGVFSMAQILV